MPVFKSINRKLVYSSIATCLAVVTLLFIVICAITYSIESLPVAILLFIALCAIIYSFESSAQEKAAKMYGSGAAEVGTETKYNQLKDVLRKG